MSWRDDCDRARAELEAFAQGWTFEASPMEPTGWAAKQRGARSYRVRIACGPHEWTGPYSVGSGIPAAWAVRMLDERGGRIPRVRGLYSARDVRSLASGSRYSRSIHGDELAQRIADAYRPELVDVLGALFADASGMEPFATLRGWIDATGFEFEHPADAVDTFEACKRSAAFLHSACGDAFDRCAELAGEL